MKKTPNIFFIGPMGSGKTTIGRLIAKELGKKFFDSDQEIETKAGVSISWIFDVEGEAGFRERETKIIEELTSRSNIVLATGGGAILKSENRSFLAGRGHVIYLQVSIPQQLIRLQKAQNRPLLKTDDPKAKLEALILQREALYQEIADKVIETDNLSITTIVNNILKYLENTQP